MNRNGALGENLLHTLFKEVTGSREVKTAAIVETIKLLTGTAPRVVNKGPYNLIVFTPAQRAKLEAMFDKKVKQVRDKRTGKTEPQNVKVDFKSLVMPLVIKKALPYVLGVAAIGFVLGRVSKKGR